MTYSKKKNKKNEILNIVEKNIVHDQEWSQVTLEDVASEISVGYVGPMASEYIIDGIPFLRSQNVNYLKINLQDIKFISSEFHKRLKKSSLSPGDVVIVRTGNPGTCAVIPKDLEISNCSDLVIVRCGDKIDPYFLAYYVNSSASHHIAAHLVGAVQQHFNVSSTRTIKLNLPPIQEQKSISKILKDLDLKIEINQQMNKTIEKICKIIFKYWFVDFEFPNENGNPYKSSGGKMIYNEELEKEIPIEWKVGKLEDFIFVERGLSYKGSGLSTKGMPMINLGNMSPNNNFKYNGLKFYSGDFKERHLVKPGDLIMANTDITQKREILGSCLIVPKDLGEDKILFTHHIYAIRLKNEKEFISKYFLTYLFQNPEFRERAAGFATGTTVLALPKDAILNLHFPIPNEKLMELFDKITKIIKNKNSNNIVENKNLLQIRDSLLPKLLSGKIRVPVEVN